MNDNQSSNLKAVVREIICEHDDPICPKCDLNSAEIVELREVAKAQADNGDHNSYLNRALDVIDELTGQYNLWLADQQKDWELYYKLLEENKGMQAKLAELSDLELDKKMAAGELLVEVPEPGTNAAKLLTANVLLRRRAELAEHKVYRLEAYLERITTTIGNYFKVSK